MPFFKKRTWPKLEPLTEAEKAESRISHLYQHYHDGIKADIPPNMMEEIAEELATRRAALQLKESGTKTDPSPA